MTIRKSALTLVVTAALSASTLAGSASAAKTGAAAGTCDTGGICLTVGLALVDPNNPALCGAATTLDVAAGEQVNYCYTVVNGSGVDLGIQSLDDDVHGSLFAFDHLPLAQGASLQYNRVATAGASQTIVSTWTAQTARPGYDAAVGNLDPGAPDCSDRVFASGFEAAPPDCPGMPSDFIDIADIGTPLDLGDDDAATVSLPFAFDFFGENASELCIANNGYILVDADECIGFLFGNEPLPSPNLNSRALLPFWDDLYIGGNVYTATVGVAPNRRFVVEWLDKNHYNPSNDDPGGITFEVVFGEDGTLAFNYLKTTFESDPSWDNGGSATVGLQWNHGLANEFSSNSASLQDLSFVGWTATNPVVFSDSDAGVTLNVSSPRIDVQPPSLSGTAAAGASTTVMLDIGNIGTSDLHWTLDEAPPMAHFVAMPGSYRYSSPAPRAADRARVAAQASPLGKRARIPRPAPLAGGAAPAFGISAPTDYVSFDAADPVGATWIETLPDTPLYKTGTFVNNDFTREFVASISGGEGTATIDTATGLVTPLGGPPTAHDELWFGLKWDATTGTLYGAGCTKGIVPATCHLYTVNPFSGEVTQGPLVSGADDPELGIVLLDIAISPAGLMYGINYFTGDLVAIDKTSGAAQIVGNTGYVPAFVQSLDFDPASGLLYWAAFDGDEATMFTVDTATGQLTTVGTLAGGETFAFAVATSGSHCATPADQDWLTAAPAAGTMAPGGATQVTVTLDAASLSAGDHEADLCVFSDDPYRSVVAVPVTFTVTPGGNPVPPTLAKAFAPSSVLANTPSTLTITLGNGNSTPATLTTGLADALPEGLVIAPTPNAATTCGGTLDAPAGSGIVTLASDGAEIPANGSCTVTVDVRATAVGDYVNTIAAGALQTTAGNNSAAASATLGVTALDPPTLAKSFAPSNVSVDAPSRLTITLGNGNPTDVSLSAAMTDDLPSGLVVSPTPNIFSGCGGTVAAAPGSTSITLPFGVAAIPANGSCQIQVDVQAASAGTYTNTIPAGALQTIAGSNAADAVATLTVSPAGASAPTVAAIFAPANVGWNEPSRLTVTLGNANATAATLLSPLTDTLPAGIVVAAAPNASTTCAAALTANAGDASVSLAAGAVIPAGGACALEFDVVGTVAGDFQNTIFAGALVTDLGSNTSDVTATLKVASPAAPAVAIAFSTTSVAAGTATTMTLTIGNANASAIGLASAFVVPLPGGLVIAAPANAATTCGGALTANAGDPALTLDAAGAAVPALGTCTITADIVAANAGAYAMAVPADALSTSAGGNVAASGNLIVTGAFPAPYCPTSFSSSVEPITFLNFAGLVVGSPADILPGGSPSQHQDFTNLTDGSVAPQGGYPMSVRGNTDGNYQTFVRAFFDWNHDGTFGSDESFDIGEIVNSTGLDGVEASRLIVVPPTATPGLTRMRIVKAYGFYPGACGNNGYGQAEDYLIDVDPSLPVPATPALVGNAFSPNYLPAPDAISTLTLTLTNYNASPLALTADFVDALPAGLVVAPTPNASTKCENGSVTATPGSGTVALGTGASIPANSACEVFVDVTAANPGIFVNTLAEGAAQTANGGSPYASSAAVQFASPLGTPTYATGFEPPFAAGALDGQLDWFAQANIAAVPSVAATAPSSGAQHVTMTATSSTTTAFYPLILSPVQPIGTSPYSYASARLRISRLTNGASWEFDPQDFANGLVAARVRFDKLAARSIQVRDFASGAFVDTGAQWPIDTYFTVKVVIERATGVMDICMDGAPIFHGDTGASVGSRNITDIAILQGLQANSTAGNTLFVDDVVVDNAPAGGCN